MTIKFGIIGLGSISSKFSEMINKCSGVELYAVASRDIKKASEFANKFQAKIPYGNYIDLINDPKVDAIYIGVPHNFHYDIAKAALNNKKAVLCEKPLATNPEDVKELIELAKKNNTLLIEGMKTRCLPAIKKAKEWINSNAIGNIKLIDSAFCFKSEFDINSRLYNPNLAGGSLFDVGIYPIELAIGLLEKAPINVSGFASIGKSNVDEFASFNMIFEDGILASCKCGITANTKNDAYIYGNNGYIFIENFSNSRKCQLFDSEDNLLETFEDTVEDGFIHEIYHFSDLYNNNKIESDLIPFKDTLDSIEIICSLIDKNSCTN